MKNVTFSKNSVIFKEGDPSDLMYDIRWGKVGIYANYGTPEQVLLTTLIGDQFLGEMGVIERKPRSATAVALEETTAVALGQDDFVDYLADKPAKALAVLQNTAHRLRELSADFVRASIAVNRYVEAEEAGKKQSVETLDQMKKIAANAKKKK